MDAYSLASLFVTALAIAFRRSILIRLLCVGFLLWLGILHHLDVQQAERMLMHADPLPPSSEPSVQRVDPDMVVRVLQRTPAGFTAFVCAIVLALVPTRAAPRDRGRQ